MQDPGTLGSQYFAIGMHCTTITTTVEANWAMMMAAMQFVPLRSIL